MPRCLIALGSNLGDRKQLLDSGIALLSAEPGIVSVVASCWHENPPIGGPPGQGPFLNGAATLETSLSSDALHALLQRVEICVGRMPAARWGARALDLDLLCYGDEIIHTPTLRVPHPRMAFRRFVLEPAVQVAPDLVHPTIGWTLWQLLAHLNQAAPYVALLGPSGSGKTVLAQALSQSVEVSYLADPAVVLRSASGSDPPSPALGRQIQFLDQRAALLSAERWQTSKGAAVSDFYFDQALAYARVELDERDHTAFQATWAAWRPRVVGPKLLVVLDAPAGLKPDSPAGDRVREQLWALAKRPGIGPVLDVGQGDLPFRVNEIAAALAAMR